MTDSQLGARARARLETISEIKRIAREHLAADGPDLSLRAVARDLGVVSSAVYRYFDSRDALLTALIIEGYDALGEVVEQAEALVPRVQFPLRWFAIGHAIRDWARANPHEYALLYGSPVPGYAAPGDTIGPASRPVVVFAALLRDAGGRGLLADAPLPAAVLADITAIDGLFDDMAPAIIARAMIAWTQLFGALSFELFGRLTNAITDYDAWFDHQLDSMAGYLGLG